MLEPSYCSFVSFVLPHPRCLRRRGFEPFKYILFSFFKAPNINKLSLFKFLLFSLTTSGHTLRWPVFIFFFRQVRNWYFPSERESPKKKEKEERQNNFKRQMVIWSNSIVLMPLGLKGVIWMHVTISCNVSFRNQLPVHERVQFMQGSIPE